MPTYVYECTSCYKRFEVIRSISEQSEQSATQKCPDCKAQAFQDYSGIAINARHSNPFTNDDSSYMDDSIGEVVTSGRQRKELLKAKGLQVKEEGTTHDQKVKIDDMKHQEFVRESAKKKKDKRVITRNISSKELDRKMKTKKFVRQVVGESMAGRK